MDGMVRRKHNRTDHLGNIISLAKMVKTSSTIVRRSVNLILNINLLLTQYDRYVFPPKISDGLLSSLRLNVPILLLTRCITATASTEKCSNVILIRSG